MVHLVSAVGAVAGLLPMAAGMDVPTAESTRHLQEHEVTHEDAGLRLDAMGATSLSFTCKYLGIGCKTPEWKFKDGSCNAKCGAGPLDDAYECSTGTAQDCSGLPKPPKSNISSAECKTCKKNMCPTGFVRASVTGERYSVKVQCKTSTGELDDPLVARFRCRNQQLQRKKSGTWKTLLNRDINKLCDADSTPDVAQTTAPTIFPLPTGPANTDTSPNNMRLLLLMIVDSRNKRWTKEDGTVALENLEQYMEHVRLHFLYDSWGAIRLETTIPKALFDMRSELATADYVGKKFADAVSIMADKKRQREAMKRQQKLIDRAAKRAGVRVKLDEFDLWFMLHPNDHSWFGNAGNSYFYDRHSYGDCIFKYDATEINPRCGSIITHELYHSLGLMHSSARLKGESLSYGHLEDIMGNNYQYGMRTLGLPMRYKMGWAPREQLHMVTDLATEQTFDFAPFGQKTTDMIGVMIPLECTTVFVSLSDSGAFMVEYALMQNKSPALFSVHRASQENEIKVGDFYYEPMADLTIERTDTGANLYPGRHSVTHEDTHLEEDVISVRSTSETTCGSWGFNCTKKRTTQLVKPFVKGCGALRNPAPASTCRGSPPGVEVQGMNGGTGVAFRRDPERQGVQRYECRDGEWILEAGLPVQYCRNQKHIPGNTERCPSSSR